MTPATVTASRPQPSPTPARTQARTRTRGWLVIALIVGAVALAGAYNRIQEDRLRKPLEAAERASDRAQKPIALLDPATARRWTSASGPTEQKVLSLIKPGNAYVEPLFFYYSGQHGGPGGATPSAGSRCYYFPAQHGAEFDADRVSALVQLCYVGSGDRLGSGWVAIQ